MPHTIDSEALEAKAAAEGTSAAGKRSYVQRIFSEIAPRYDLLNRLLSLGIDRRWRTLALQRLGWDRAPEGTYLDLCAGTLDVGAELSRKPGFGGRIVGADFAEPMLRAGVGKAPAEILTPVVADALALPVRDDTFDGAIVAFGIRNVADLVPRLCHARPGQLDRDDDAVLGASERLARIRDALPPGVRSHGGRASTTADAEPIAVAIAYLHGIYDQLPELR